MYPPAVLVRTEAAAPLAAAPRFAEQFVFQVAGVTAGQPGGVGGTQADPFQVSVPLVHLHPARLVAAPVPAVLLPDGHGGQAKLEKEKMKNKKMINCDFI